MKQTAMLLAALAIVGGCSAGDGDNPFSRAADTTTDTNTDTSTDTSTDTGTDTSTDTSTDTGTDTSTDTSADAGDSTEDNTLSPIDGGLTPPPGTPNPTPTTGIFRYEEQTAEGNGFALRPMYTASTDTFQIDNLAFDGPNSYTRDNQVASLGPTNANGPFAVYESAEFVTDPVSGKQIEQLQHKAIYAVSNSGATEVAVIRTGGYTGYGFGGFIYQRNDGHSVVIPTTGQARFDGDYAALRDFNGIGGLEYAVAKIQIDIDFEDFNGEAAQDAVKGRIYDRKIYNTAGTDITQNVVDAINGMSTDGLIRYTSLPVIRLDIGPNTVDKNGEVLGSHQSLVNVDGEVQQFEVGNYYAVLAGDNPNEIAGIVVSEVADPRYTNVTVRETGAFIAER